MSGGVDEGSGSCSDSVAASGEPADRASRRSNRQNSPRVRMSGKPKSQQKSNSPSADAQEAGASEDQDQQTKDGEPSKEGGWFY